MRPGDEEWQLSVKITAKQNSFVGATSPLVWTMTVSIFTLLRHFLLMQYNFTSPYTHSVIEYSPLPKRRKVCIFGGNLNLDASSISSTNGTEGDRVALEERDDVTLA